MIERCGTTIGVEFPYGNNCLVYVLSGDKTRRQLFKGTEAGGKFFQPFLSRQINQCASGNHICSVTTGIAGVPPAMSAKREQRDYSTLSANPAMRARAVPVKRSF